MWKTTPLSWSQKQVLFQNPSVLQWPAYTFKTDIPLFFPQKSTSILFANLRKSVKITRMCYNVVEENKVCFNIEKNDTQTSIPEFLIIPPLLISRLFISHPSRRYTIPDREIKVKRPRNIIPVYQAYACNMKHNGYAESLRFSVNGDSLVVLAGQFLFAVLSRRTCTHVCSAPVSFTVSR